jgi:regulatory protein
MAGTEPGGQVITALRPVGPASDLLMVVVDGQVLARVSQLTVARLGLHTGMVVTEALAETLASEGAVHTLLEAAVRYLGYRPRSEQEIRTYVRRRKATPEQAEAVLEQLRQLHYVDDAAFAQFWRESRDRAAPRGERLLRAELLGKGVARDIVTEAMPDADDEEVLARRVAERAVRRLRGLPWQEFRDKLWGQLQRRGFSYGVANRIIKELWEAE